MRFVLFSFIIAAAFAQTMQTTVAGVGGRGNGSLQLTFPGGVAFDAQDNLYIADVYNHRIQRLSPDGFIVTVAGTGERGAGENQFFFPRTIALDRSGMLYVADSYAHRVQKISPDGTVQTIAGRGGQGSGLTQLSYPRGIAVDPDGNVFVGDNYNHRVLKVTPEGIISVVAGNGGQGPGPNQLNFPSAVALDAEGSLFIADSYNHRVQKISAAGVATTVAGTTAIAGPGERQLANPVGVDVDAAGNIYIADCGNHRVQKITPSGFIQTIAGGNGEGAGERQLNQPFDTAVDGAGNLYIADAYNHRIQKVTFPASLASPQTWHSATNRQSPGSPNLLVRLSPRVGCPSPLSVNVGGYPAESISTSDGLLFTVPEFVDGGVPTEVFVSCESRSILPVIKMPMTPALPRLFTNSTAQAWPEAVKAGDLISVYGSGFGSLEPVDGLARRRVSGLVTATIGGITADVLYAGTAPGQPTGIQQINLRVPSGLAGGAQQLLVFLDGVSTQGSVIVVVQPDA